MDRRDRLGWGEVAVGCLPRNLGKAGDFGEELGGWFDDEAAAHRKSVAVNVLTAKNATPPVKRQIAKKRLRTASPERLWTCAKIKGSQHLTASPCLEVWLIDLKGVTQANQQVVCGVV